jgi:hypothetical protein
MVKNKIVKFNGNKIKGNFTKNKNYLMKHYLNDIFLINDDDMFPYFIKSNEININFTDLNKERKQKIKKIKAEIKKNNSE